MTQREANAISECGAKFMDKEDHGWERHINLRSLCMKRCKDCILGQRWGNYQIGLRRSGIGFSWAADLGFTIDQSGMSYDLWRLSPDWKRLDIGWKKAINRRRKK
jgi:hypothetical protein